MNDKKLLPRAKTESDKNYLQRKYATLDKQIDELVYQLYGLTEEEIRLVEGNENLKDVKNLEGELK